MGPHVRRRARCAASAALAALALATAAGCSERTERAVAPPPPPPRGAEGAACHYLPCEEGLECTPGSKVCARPDHPELEAARARARAREAEVLARSGVTTPTRAEAPAAPAGPDAAGAVRVVRVSNDAVHPTVFAACRADERLVGGGCRLLTPGLTMVLDSFPSHHGESDTLGARWNCGRVPPDRWELEAFALCQRVIGAPP
ncbi:MAG: hypothetical protein KJZ91_27665 [Myxococcales bacterium]|nr:hypothetical protein [Myxococcales bacterium]